MNARPWWLTSAIMLLAALLALVAVGPALLLLLISMQPEGTELLGLGLDKGGPTLRNFTQAWEQGRLAGPLVNSVIVTAARAGANVLLAALAAYPLARMRFRGRAVVSAAILSTMMIPEQVIVVPMFRTVVALGMADTLAALVLPFAVSAFGIVLCAQAYRQIPASLEEAARLDGAGDWQVWRHVMVPLAAPTLSTLALFSVIGAWSELLWPLVVISSESRYTLPVAINGMLGEFATNIRLAYAGSVLALVPILVLFLALQRWLRPQMFAGAVKG